MQFKNFSPHKIKGSSKKGKYKEEYPIFKDAKWNADFGFGIDKSGQLWIYENRKIDSYKEKAPE